MNFEHYNFTDKVLRGIKDAGFTECTPVQVEVFKHTLQGKDVAVQSQTGTGKTAAFLLTIMDLFQRDNSSWKKALIVVPTRELAVQIETEAKELGKHLDYRIGSFYGGIGYQVQEKMLAEGVDITVGTPGRLLDFGKSRKMRFKDFDIVIIDEADRLFDMGFLPDLRRMMKQMKPLENRLTMLFSATLSSRVHRLAWDFMNAPVEISIAPEKVTVDEISQSLYHVSRDEKVSLLLGILKHEDPESAIIFTNTKREAVELSHRLSANGFHNKYLMGDLPQKKRLKIIERVKAGEQRILIATDVAARGLHIEDLALVVNYDIPEDYENYVHRIGRTARAGKTGKAITLACEKYVYGLEAIEKFIGTKIKAEWPPEDFFVKDETEGKRFHHHHPTGSRTNQHSRKPPRRQPNRQNRHPAEEKKAAPPRKNERKTDNRSDARSARRDGGFEQSSEKEQKRPSGSIDDRLDYYRKKYGEDFKVVSSPETKEQKKKGFLRRKNKRSKEK
jgi:ATP-dependent RNA helicase RhlB